MAIKMFIVSKGFVQFHLNVLHSLNVVCICVGVLVSWHFHDSLNIRSAAFAAFEYFSAFSAAI